MSGDQGGGGGPQGAQRATQVLGASFTHCMQTGRLGETIRVGWVRPFG